MSEQHDADFLEGVAEGRAQAAAEIERLKAALQQAREDAKLLQQGLIALIADETNGELAKARAARAALEPQAMTITQEQRISELRYLAKFKSDDDVLGSVPYTLLEWAADEIERLKAALRTISTNDLDANIMASIAWAALEGK